MFNKLHSVTKYSNNIIDIKELSRIVKNNPQKNLIDRLRTLEYGSNEYKQLKTKLNCITPHGTFNSLRGIDLIEYSSYLYYDIDGIDTFDELNDTIFSLIDNFPISFIQRSVSNKGFHFLIKIDDTLLQLNDTLSFTNIHKYVASLLIDKGYNIDLSATGLVRKMIISSDFNCYLNLDNILYIDSDLYNQWYKLFNNLSKVKITSKSKEKESIELNDTFSLIPFNILCKELITTAKYTKEIDGDYIVEDMEYYYIYTPEIIKDGTKHSLYTRIVNALYFLNESPSRSQILSYIYYINNRATPRMEPKYLYSFITRLCDNIEQNGYRLKPKIKKIHFNENSNLTKKQKQIMAAKINGNEKTNKTIKIIEKAKLDICSNNEKLTQKKVAEITGLSIATIKRNWNKNTNDNFNVEVPEIIEGENIKKEIIIDLELLSEDDFFNNK